MHADLHVQALVNLDVHHAQLVLDALVVEYVVLDVIHAVHA